MGGKWREVTVNEIAAPVRNALVGGPFGSNLVSRDYVLSGVPVIRGQNMGVRWVLGEFVFVSYNLPEDFLEKKEELKAGLRMKLKAENNQIIIYDPITQNFKTIEYSLIDKKEGIFFDNPLVFDIDNRKPKDFPIIDRERKMITVYSRRQRILTTFTLPDKYFDLPEYTWNAGDEVRIYFKERKALRLINTTKLGFVKD